jgi:hypothetical protein
MTSKPFSASPLALSKVPVLPEEEEWVIQRAQCAGKRREEKDMRDRLRDIGGGMSRFVKVGVGRGKREEGRGKREEGRGKREEGRGGKREEGRASGGVIRR